MKGHPRPRGRYCNQLPSKDSQLTDEAKVNCGERTKPLLFANSTFPTFNAIAGKVNQIKQNY